MTTKSKAIKIILPIAVIIIALIAIYFGVPFKDFKEARETNQKPYPYNRSLWDFCKSYWSDKFKGKPIDGGELPEVTVIPQPVDENAK